MLKPEDIMVDTYRPSKRSGLRVGVDYGVKVTHKPTGIFVVEDSERSQQRNREFALQKLDKLVADAQTTGAAELPQALRLADELRKMDEAKKYHLSGPGGQMLGCEQYRLVASGFTFEYLQSAAAELRRLHAYCQELESQVILDCMTHVQNPAEIEHVAGDVSKNGAESNMAQQPAPSAAVEVGRATVNRAAVMDWFDQRGSNWVTYDDLASLFHTHPTPQADSQPAMTPETVYAAIAHGDEEHRAWLLSALRAVWCGEAVPPVTSPIANAAAESQPAPEYVGNGMFKGETIKKAAEHWANWCDVRCMTGLSEFLRVVAAHAPTDSH